MADNITIRKILTILQSEYPGSFAYMDQRTMALKVELWETEFGNDNLQLVYAAVRMYMKKPAQFAPSIGQIRENMNFLLKSDKGELTDQDAWLLVSKACANGLHHSGEEFNKLPPEVQKAVGGPEQLKAWAAMGSETVESVISSNFKKTFRTTKERTKQLELMTPEMKAVIAGIAETMQLKEETQVKLKAPKKEPAMFPVPLEPMKAMPKVELPKVEPKPTYKPPSGEEWAKKREEAMNKLLGNKP